MKKIFKISFFSILLLVEAGCASMESAKAQQERAQEFKKTSDRLNAMTHKFELARAENLNLKKEITLLRKYQDIDSKSFIQASERIQRELESDIAAGDVRVKITERGLSVGILAEKIFITGTDDLSDKGKIFLDRIATLLEENFPANYLYIEGHTDNQSLAVFEWKSDWDFSFARALVVLKYFTENKHMDAWRLSAAGLGQYRPWATNETKDGRRLNRRIEIIISPQKTRGTKTHKDSQK